MVRFPGAATKVPETLIIAIRSQLSAIAANTAGAIMEKVVEGPVI